MDFTTQVPKSYFGPPSKGVMGLDKILGGFSDGKVLS